MTPDGRYIVVRRQLWRRANPNLSDHKRQRLVDELMGARRVVRQALKAGDQTTLALARATVDGAKIALGERGPVWWTDGAPDMNRHMVGKTSHASWYEALTTIA